MSIPRDKYVKSLDANLRRFLSEFRTLQRELKFALERHATEAQIIPGGEKFSDYLAWGKQIEIAVDPMLASVESLAQGMRKRVAEIAKHARDVAGSAVSEYPDGDDDSGEAKVG